MSLQFVFKVSKLPSHFQRLFAAFVRNNSNKFQIHLNLLLKSFKSCSILLISSFLTRWHIWRQRFYLLLLRVAPPKSNGSVKNHYIQKSTFRKRTRETLFCQQKFKKPKLKLEKRVTRIWSRLSCLVFNYKCKLDASNAFDSKFETLKIHSQI